MCDDGWCCFTMEIGRPLRQGRYALVTGYSAAMNRPLLAFRNENGAVVGFIHPGTQQQHVSQHVMLGMDRAVDIVVDSRRAYQELELRVSEAGTLFGEDVTVVVQPLQSQEVQQ